MMRLGGKVLGFSSAASSSASKGESVADTIRMISCYADIAAMRHNKEGAPRIAAQYAGIPVINAGDGGHQHPTQTLTDLLTIRREKKRLDNLTIGLCGDLTFGRTVHSLIETLCRFGNVRFILISPKELRTPQYVLNRINATPSCSYEEVSDLTSVIGDLDALYMTRVQKERFFNEDDYLRLRDTYILDEAKLALAKPDMAVLHPLPRVNEIAKDVDNDPRAAYFEQVKNGMLMRMALESSVLETPCPVLTRSRTRRSRPDGSHQHSGRHHHRPCARGHGAQSAGLSEHQSGVHEARAHHEHRFAPVRHEGHHQDRGPGHGDRP